MYLQSCNLKLPLNEYELLEESIYNENLNDCNIKGINDDALIAESYKLRCRQILNHLSTKSYIGNSGLKMNVLKNIAKLTPKELYPEKWRKNIKSQQEEDRILLSNNETPTDMFKCGKCLQSKCSYTEVQTRSMDESATLFISCLNPKCKNRWKQ